MLGEYSRRLGDLGDLKRLKALATDVLRHKWMSRVTGGITESLVEIRTTQTAILAEENPDIGSLAQLAIIMHSLKHQNLYMPPTLPEIWLKLGDLEHAKATLGSITNITNAHTRRKAEQEFSEVLISRMSDSIKSGDLGTAEAHAAAIPIPESRAKATVMLTCAMADAGQRQRAIEMARLACQLVASVPDMAVTWEVLSKILTLLVRLNGLRTAESVIRSLDDRAQRVVAEVAYAFALVKAGKKAQGIKMAERIYETAIAEHGSSIPTELCLFLATVFILADRPHRVEAVVSRVPEPEVRAWALVSAVESYARTKNREEVIRVAAIAESAAREIVDIRAQGESLGLLTGALVMAGEHNRAEMISQTITDPKLEAIAIGCQVPALAESGHHEKAVELAQLCASISESIADLDTRFKTLALAVQLLIDIGERRFAMAILTNAKRSAEVVGNPASRSKILYEVASQLALIGECERAEAVAGEISDTSLRVKAFTSIVNATGLEERKRGRLVVRALRDGNGNTYENMNALAALVRTLMTLGDEEQARKVARHMEDLTNADHNAGQEFIDFRPPVLLVRAWFKVGDREKGMWASRTVAAKFGAVTNSRLGAEALTCLAETLADSGEHQEAAAIVQDIERIVRERPGLVGQCTALSILAGELANLGEYDRARTVCDAIMQAAGRVRALASLAGVLIEARMHSKAVEIAETIERIARETTPNLAEETAHSQDRKAKALEGILGAFASALQRGEAGIGSDELAESIMELTSPERSLVVSAVTWALVGDYARAEAIIGFVIQSEARSHMLVSVADAMVKAGELARAVAVAEKAEAAAEGISKADDQVNALVSVADAMVKARNYEKAEAVLPGRNNASDRPALTNSVIQALGEAGQYAHAERLLEDVEDPAYRIQGLAYLAQALVVGGQKGQALQLAHVAASWIDTHSAIFYNSEIPVTLADVLAGAGDIPRARRLISRSLMANGWSKALHIIRSTDPSVLCDIADDPRMLELATDSREDLRMTYSTEE